MVKVSKHGAGASKGLYAGFFGTDLDQHPLGNPLRGCTFVMFRIYSCRTSFGIDAEKMQNLCKDLLKKCFAITPAGHTCFASGSNSFAMKNFLEHSDKKGI